jgi:Flp pilus assembly protein TadD
MMRALALDPDQAVALHLRAIRLVEQGRLDEAEELLDRLARRGKRDHSVLNTVGMLRFEQGDLPGAIAQFEHAIELNGFVPEFRYNLALSYEVSGRCREARVKWLTYLRSEPDERRRAVVQARLKRNFDTEGGRCFGLDR